MLPILISVSVAPVSYFFSASAPLLYADRIVFAENEGRVEYTRIWTRPDRSRWKIELGPMASTTASAVGLSDNQPRRRAVGR